MAIIDAYGFFTTLIVFCPIFIFRFIFFSSVLLSGYMDTCFAAAFAIISCNGSNSLSLSWFYSAILLLALRESYTMVFRLCSGFACDILLVTALLSLCIVFWSI